MGAGVCCTQVAVLKFVVSTLPQSRSTHERPTRGVFPPPEAMLIFRRDLTRRHRRIVRTASGLGICIGASALASLADLWTARFADCGGEQALAGVQTCPRLELHRFNGTQNSTLVLSLAVCLANFGQIESNPAGLRVGYA